VDFGDTVAPQVLDFSPKNGETNVEPTTIVTFTFSEPIELGPAAKSGTLTVTLSRFEEDEVLKFVEEIELKPPGVNVVNQLLKVDLNGKIQAGSHYTLSLPSGAVSDREQNAFTGLAPRAYAFKTASAAEVYQVGGEASSTGVSLISLIAVSGGLIVVLGICILAVWWMNLRHAARRKAMIQQHPPVAPRTSSKLGSSSTIFLDSTGRSPSQRSSLSSMRSSASFIHLDGKPKTQAPLDAFTGAKSEPTSDFDPFADNTEKPKLNRAGTWAPGMVPTVHQKSEGDTRSSSKPHRKEEQDARRLGGEEERRRKKEEDSRRKLEAKQRWASARNMAFAQATKEASATSRPGATEVNAEPSGPRSAGDAGFRRAVSEPAPERAGSRESGHAQRPPSSQTAEARSTSKKSKTSADGNQGRDSGSPTTPQGGAARSRTSTATASDENPELSKLKKDVEKRLRGLMDSPIEVRKKALKELMLEYHPDKNSDQHATQIFQFINGSKQWFLCEA